MRWESISRNTIYTEDSEFKMTEQLLEIKKDLSKKLKKDRFEPSQPLAMAIRPEEFPCSISFSQDDPRLIRYLKGETIALTEKDPGKGQKGWCLVCAEEFPLGWGKLSGDSIKNKYYPGWRWQ